MSDTTTDTLTHTITSTTDDGKVYHRIHIKLDLRVGYYGPAGDITITSDDGADDLDGQGIGLSGTNLSDTGLLHFAKVADEFYGGYPTDRITSAVKFMLYGNG